ncbi:MAG TPA: hypothetical protein VL551_03030 [Actinospica sp.]|jgi:hypothetical protein|nr:hypothetical protein [Actinospica sp.]
MTVVRPILLVLGIFLLIAAVVVALIHVREPIPGMHCLAIGLNKNGQYVRACPDTRSVRHIGVAISLAVAAVILIATSALGMRRS